MARRVVLADRWRVEGKLGSGTWSDVYVATDMATRRRRAVKRLRSEFSRVERVRARFVAEASAMQRLAEHPHVLAVHHVQDDERPWFVMDFAEHGNVLAHIPEGGMDPRGAIRITRQLLSGLAAAHDLGIVHRDVQPANVLLAGVPPEVRVADFGVARLESDRDQLLTLTGEHLGTWFYMAPEQRVDPRDVDARADQYGAAATLFHLLARRRPPDLSLLERRPDMLEGLPAHLARVIAQATRKSPEDRFPDVRTMAAELRIP